MSQSNDGDGRSRVSLAELIALRTRVGRAKLAALVSRSARSGQQSSRLYGRGMDYAESRVYQAGDDVRRLDWRLTARSGKLHTKLFQEDREGSLLILVDTHSSMRFGTRVRFKSVQAARSAACAAWYAARAGERVGVMAFGQADSLLGPQAGPRGALAVCGALAEWDARPTSDRTESLADALTRANRLRCGASRVLLISDGFSANTFSGDVSTRQRLLDLSRHTAVSVLVVADALEVALVPPGRYPLEQTGERTEVILQSERQRRDFQRAIGAGPARLGELAQSLGLRWGNVDTTADPFDAVIGVLGARRSA
ncbi:uncharacterized protein (DUF58 family) [Rhodanobacter sp. MP1X3]|nr:DUF58 domain-containing protein [Rhodanobacter sp. MP1X3]MBB6241323.1 uncharacterized protein (DUF58 family) [Rhodanobacter sp. MP1X3]